MPDAQHFDVTSAHAVVEVIANPGEVKSPHILRPGIRDWRTDTRLETQKGKGPRKLLVKGLRG
jgi:hypothetical protein